MSNQDNPTTDVMQLSLGPQLNNTISYPERDQDASMAYSKPQQPSGQHSHSHLNDQQSVMSNFVNAKLLKEVSPSVVSPSVASYKNHSQQPQFSLDSCLVCHKFKLKLDRLAS